MASTIVPTFFSHLKVLCLFGCGALTDAVFAKFLQELPPENRIERLCLISCGKISGEAFGKSGTENLRKLKSLELGQANASLATDVSTTLRKSRRA